MDTFSSELTAIIISGEMKDRRAEFGNSFDPSYTTTEGQYRALYMKLNRIVNQTNFTMNMMYKIEGNRAVYFVGQESSQNTIFYAIVSTDDFFSDQVISNLKLVANRGGVYTSKKFYLEISSLEKSEINPEIFDEVSPDQAKNIINTLIITPENIEFAGRVFSKLVLSEIYASDNLFTDIIRVLNELPPEIDADQILDACFQIAKKYDRLHLLDRAFQLYLRIAEVSVTYERLALMITCRLRCAQIAREQDQDVDIILNILGVIDDGSLEVARQDERELFYTMQGFCFDSLGQEQLAEDLHYMSVMISESETSPSIYVAESHAYLGKIAGQRYQPDIATRQYITASTICLANENMSLAIEYSHQAACFEIQWSRFLASTAVVMNSNADIPNTEFYSWQSMKRIVNSLNHADPQHRLEEIIQPAKQILAMIRQIFPKSSQYGMSTINDVENQLSMISEGSMPPDQEKELLKFTSSKISAMLPLPPPVVLLIANDGRLILGGEIGQEKWDQSILVNDDLFSGALSAIMAILSEVITGDDPLRMLDAGQTQIMIEKSSVCIGALLVDRDLNILRKGLIEVVKTVENEYPGLEDWDGYSIDFRELKPKIEAIFEEALEDISK